MAISKLTGDLPDKEYLDPHGECAAEIHRLRAKLREAEKVIRPFAQTAVLWDGEPDYEPLILKRADMHPMAEVTCTVGDLRLAAAWEKDLGKEGSS